MNDAAETINKGERIMVSETKYYGIWIQEQNGHYWIFDDEGGNLYCGEVEPTPELVASYRNELLDAVVAKYNH